LPTAQRVGFYFKSSFPRLLLCGCFASAASTSLPLTFDGNSPLPVLDIHIAANTAPRLIFCAGRLTCGSLVFYHAELLTRHRAVF
jgi:hypothetical protein